MEGGRIEYRQEEQDGAVLVASSVRRHQFPAAVVAANYRRPGVDNVRQLGTSLAPHLLELHANLVESLGDDGDENVFDEPTQEEDHRREVHERAPGRQRVHCPVHDKHPAFLRESLVHREDAGCCLVTK